MNNFFLHLTFITFLFLLNSCSISNYEKVYELIDEERYVDAGDELKRPEYFENLKYEKLYLATVVEYNLGNLAEALFLSDELLKKKVDNSDHFYIAGQINYDLGNYFIAYQHALTAYNYDKDNYSYAYLYARAAEKINNPEEAQKIVSHLIRLDKDDVRGRLLKIQLNFYYKSLFYETAELESACYSILEDDPNYIDTYTLLSVILLSSGKFSESFVILNKVVSDYFDKGGNPSFYSKNKKLFINWANMGLLTDNWDKVSAYSEKFPEDFYNLYQARNLTAEKKYTELIDQYRDFDDPEDKSFLLYSLFQAFLAKKDSFGISEYITKRSLVDYDRYEIFDHSFSKSLVDYYIDQKQNDLAEISYQNHKKYFLNYRTDLYYELYFRTLNGEFAWALTFAEKENFTPDSEREQKLLSFLYFVNRQYEKLVKDADTFSEINRKNSTLALLENLARINIGEEMKPVNKELNLSGLQIAGLYNDFFNGNYDSLLKSPVESSDTMEKLILEVIRLEALSMIDNSDEAYETGLRDILKFADLSNKLISYYLILSNKNDIGDQLTLRASSLSETFSNLGFEKKQALLLTDRNRSEEISLELINQTLTDYFLNKL